MWILPPFAVYVNTAGATVGDALGDALLCDGDALGEALSLGDSEGVAVSDGTTVGDALGDALALGDSDGVAVSLGVAVSVGDGDSVGASPMNIENNENSVFHPRAKNETFS